MEDIILASKKYIDEHLMPIIIISGELLEGNMLLKLPRMI